jgi:hypothetical protein
VSDARRETLSVPARSVIAESVSGWSSPRRRRRPFSTCSRSPSLAPDCPACLPSRTRRLLNAVSARMTRLQHLFFKFPCACVAHATRGLTKNRRVSSSMSSPSGRDLLRLRLRSFGSLESDLCSQTARTLILRPWCNDLRSFDPPLEFLTIGDSCTVLSVTS